jgi:hypothetical protein
MLDLDATAESAADADRWQEVVDTLKAIDALQPSSEVKDRLTRAQLSLRINELQNDVRALTRTGNWKAVLAADAELARLDADAADPEGLATKARAELLEAELAASYARAVEQLDNRDWAGAESTFVALLNRRAGYQDAEPLLALARRKGTPATLESQPKPAAQVPAPTDSALPREEVGRLATPAPARPPARKPEPAGPAPGHLATPIARNRPRSRSPLGIAIVAGFAVVTLITIVVGTRTTGGWPWPSGTGSIVTPTVNASNTSSPRPTPSQTSTKTTTPPAPRPMWQRETDLPEPLEAAGVTVFGDAVWVVGGNAPSAGRPKLDRVWFYKNGWQPGPKLPVRLDSMPVVSDGKRLFVVGGQTSDSKGNNVKISRDVWFLDGPDDDSWQKLNPPLPDERSGGAAAWDGQRLVFAGGLNHQDRNGDGNVDDAETVNRADVWVWEGKGEWRKIGQLQRQREDLVAASDGNGRVWFLGGADAQGENRRMPLGAVDLVEKDRITQPPDIDPVRSSSAVWIADRGVCLFGGITKDSGTNKVVCLPETASQSPTGRPLPPLTLPRAGMGAAVQDKTIWLVGGFGPERKNGPGRAGLSIVEVVVS